MPIVKWIAGKWEAMFSEIYWYLLPGVGAKISAMLQVCVFPHNVCIEMMVRGGGNLGSWLDNENGALMNGVSALIKKRPYRAPQIAPYTPCYLEEKPHTSVLTSSSCTYRLQNYEQ